MNSLIVVCVALLATSYASPLRGGNEPLSNIMEHLRSLEKVAQAHSNSRSVQNGYNDSAEYVISQLSRFPDYFTVSKFHFQVPIWKEIEQPEITLNGRTFPLNRCPTRTGWLHYDMLCDYSGIRYGGSGKATVTGRVIAPANEGCQDSDWKGFPENSIAIIPTGAGCDYLDKAFQAADHGAVALVLYTPEGAPALPGSRVYRSTWQPGDRISTLPVVGVRYQVALEMQDPETTSVTIRTVQDVSIENSFNVIAETRQGNSQNVFMMGAHLDSVPAGPGLNDNGSGSSVVLETALDYARNKRKTTNVVRFGWWGAEEVGLVGSTNYVNWLVQNPAEHNRIFAYFNFDMEAGPNYIRMVYDGLTAPQPVQQGSQRITKMFQAYWQKQHMTSGLSDMGGGSDYLPFLLSNIAAGGMATGAGSHKTEAERHIHGGLANTPFDPCYHAPCDTVDNINQNAVSEIYGAVQEAVSVMVNINPELEGLRPSNRTAPQWEAFEALLKKKLKNASTCNADDEAALLVHEIHEDL